MEAQVSRVAMHPGKMDEVMAVLHEHGVPALTQAQGFAGGLWLYDPETLRGIQVVYWQSEADIARLAESGTGEETGRMLEPLMAEMQPPESFAVLYREEMPKADRPTYAVVVVPPIRSGAREEAIAVWRDAVLPVFKQQQGYAGSVILVDRTAEQVLDISLWTDDAAMRTAAERSDLHQATERLASYLAGEPTAHGYQVVHREEALRRGMAEIEESRAIGSAPTPVV